MEDGNRFSIKGYFRISSSLRQILRILSEIKLRFCFLLIKFILSDCFNSIVGISGKYIAENRDLYVFSREFNVLNSFESITNNSSKSIIRGSRSLFYLFFKSLSSWLVRKYIIILPKDQFGFMVFFKKDIEDFYISLMDLVEMFCTFFLYLQGCFCISIIY